MSRIVLLGAKQVGALALDTLVGNGLAPVLVIAAGDDDTAAAARRHGLDLLVDPPLREPAGLERVAGYAPDLLLCFSYPRILKPAFIGLFPGGCANFHPASLPRYRGCLPTIWPILNGDDRAAYTMHHLDAGIDTGNVIADIWVPIHGLDTGWSLYERLVGEVPKLLSSQLEAISRGVLPLGQPQDSSQAAYFPAKLPFDGYMDWGRAAVEVERFVRALYHPRFPGARARLGGLCLDVVSAEVCAGPMAAGPAGSVFADDGLCVRCAEGALRLTAIREPGGELIQGGAILARHPEVLASSD